MISMKHCIALMMAAPCIAFAAPLDQIIDAMSIPVAASHTNIGWEGLAKAKGVRWDWPASQSGAHDHTMRGKLRVSGAGVAEVTVTGARSFVDSVAVTLPEPGFAASLMGQGLAKIATTCDEDTGGYSVAFYRITRPGFKPLFASHTSSQGAGGAGDTAFTISNDFTGAADGVGANCTIKR